MPTVNRYDIIFTSVAIGYVDTIHQVGFMIPSYYGKLQTKNFRKAADFCLNCPGGNHKHLNI